MGLDFSTAPQNQGGELIPANTLAWATVNVRPKNMEFQKILHVGRDNPDNKYLDLEIEITAGQYTGRKVFHKIGVAGSEKWVQQGMAAIRHILEVGRRAGPENPAGYVIGANLPDGDERMWMELDGLQCAVKVGIEKGKDNYPDKNDVKQFLSPHKDSPTNKDFEALRGGAASSTIAGTTPPAPSWAAAPQPSAPTVAPASGAPSTAKPGWLGGSPPPANSGAPAAAVSDPNKAPW